jgi:uncharacterized damage-inducible protein DinB
VTDHAYRLFLDISRRKLLEQYWAGTSNCLDRLSEDQVWWRPNATSNSIGNLLLHLNGNVRQWMVAPLGGPTVNRNRPAEFAEQGPIPVSELRERLGATLKEVERILSQVEPTALESTYDIQNERGVTGFEAIYHVVEHFSMHYGQILYVTKLITGQDLGFYRYLDK